MKYFSSFGNFLGGCKPSSKMSNIIGCTCPNHSGLSVIDSLNQFEQDFDTYYLSEVSEKNFHDQHLDRQSSKNVQFLCFEGFDKQFYLL